jgi:hypothetical protein
MDLHTTHHLKRCYITTTAILLTGLTGAVLIYCTAEDPPENPFSDFENSKRFTHSVVVMGGKMSLVANDMSTWFAGLWHGQQLAFTVAVITLVIAAGYYFIASGLRHTAGNNDHPPC